ncbi:threonine/homoserine efflux transporter RhtA [Chitinophaga skermanii]|uniref:Threonine/homoserine efflux transporter RhtA n=1 Tax=Chitinophaga skermanii TaxID=331697 RepID=A0A327QR33_9BACT|nr:DMT family transporter [Chitinophaga skermanii]RAJ06488.1 threonine/homoserine efflux transporter RhtA [Chitinophaga skermanii]
MGKKNLFLLLLIVGTAFWGISYSVTKYAIGQASYATFLFYRYVLATVVLALIFSKTVRRLKRADIVTGALLAFPLLGSTLLLTIGLQYTTASQASFLTGTCVILVPILKSFIYRKALPGKTWLASGMALLGLFIICMKEQFSLSMGDLLTLGSAVSFSLYLIFVERLAAKRNIFPTIVPMFATCALITCCYALLDTSANWAPVTLGFWMSIVYCALFATAYMYTVSNVAQKYLSAEKIAIIYLFEPVFGALAAFVMLDEALSWRLLIGGCLIFVATFISQIDFRQYSLPLTKR